MKQFALLFILSSWGQSVFCQDTLTPLATRIKLKVGLYKNWDEFINNSPSMLNPFVVEPYYSQMDTTRDASLQIFKYRFTDSTVRNKRVFGFFDGKEMFISIEFNDDLFKELRQKFYKVDRIGKFPFLTVRNKISSLVSTDLLRGAVGALVSAANDNKVHLTNEIWYCNSKGRVLQATSQSIGYLLRNDKDFHIDFEKERKPGNAAFLKYLMKMNERYPYWIF